MGALMLRSVRNFREGDFIRVGDQLGRVTERGLFHTEIQTEDRDLSRSRTCTDHQPAAGDPALEQRGAEGEAAVAAAARQLQQLERRRELLQAEIEQRAATLAQEED